MVMSIVRSGSSGALLADQLLERASLQVFHGDVVSAVKGPPVVHLDDVRVLQGGGRLSLTAEALHEIRILREASVQQLERDVTSELLVLGQEHVGHPPAPRREITR